MRQKELNALVSLLDDPDNEIYSVISKKIMQEGMELIPALEKAWETTENSLIQQRIESIIHKIQYQSTKEQLERWVDSGATSLLDGTICLTRYQYPEIKTNIIENYLEKVKQKIWLELNESITALEKVKVINHIIYGVLGFSGNTTNFFSPHNHYINQLIENKKGGPVSLSIFYSLIAQKLGLPIYCVSLPRNFILAYIDRYQTSSTPDNNSKSVLFYINPFNAGAVLGKKEIEHFLTQNNIEINESYFYPCSNQTTISQLIASLMISYQKIGSQQKVDDLKQFLDILSDKESSIDNNKMGL
jgi:regulator of sirC expression with transglutaminase-like and TPR domain